MSNLKLNPLKKLEIIIEGEHQEFATDLLDRADVKGYTIVGNLSGKGSQGFHEGHLMFNEDEVLIMIIAAVPEELVEPLLEASPRSSTSTAAWSSFPTSRSADWLSSRADRGRLTPQTSPPTPQIESRVQHAV